MPNPMIQVLRPGDVTRPRPFTVFIIANPALEAPWKSGAFVVDPIATQQAAFNSCASYIVTTLFGGLPGQSERFMADPTIASKVRVISLFATGLAPEDQNSLVAQDGASNLLIPRRTLFAPFLSRYGHQTDVAYAVSRSASHVRASAWFTTDDDAGPGTTFVLDGATLSHRHFNVIPGTIALHSSSTSMTALHEFSHALSSYTNGAVVDLYSNVKVGLNNKHGRPIPSNFAIYNGSPMISDSSRDGLTYPPSWVSYHCQLLAPAFPALMDNYWAASNPVNCQHDKITRQFLMDRLRAKISR